MNNWHTLKSRTKAANVSKRILYQKIYKCITMWKRCKRAHFCGGHCIKRQGALLIRVWCRNDINWTYRMLRLRRHVTDVSKTEHTKLSTKGCEHRRKKAKMICTREMRISSARYVYAQRTIGTVIHKLCLLTTTGVVNWSIDKAGGYERSSHL